MPGRGERRGKWREEKRREKIKMYLNKFVLTYHSSVERVKFDVCELLAHHKEKVSVFLFMVAVTRHVRKPKVICISLSFIHLKAVYLPYMTSDSLCIH